MILLIDNYDSFFFNLARYFQRLGQPTHVVRNDRTDADRIQRMRPNALVLSPGPCTPREAGCCLEVIRTLGPKLPILGVCLGHQAIGMAFGGRVIRAPEPMHGRTSPVVHDGSELFRGLPCPLTACRYHSLVLDETTLPDCLRVTARTDEGIVMGVAHRAHPILGVQFHPESILTECGYQLLASFLNLAGLAAERDADKLLGELVALPDRPRPLPQRSPPNVPVTF